MKYKALILDLDGTTVPANESGRPSRRVKESILAAKEHVKVSIATGRPLYYSRKVLEDLEIDQPCVFDGGAQIINPKTDKSHFERYLSIAKQKEIVKICLRFGYYTTTSFKKTPDTEIISPGQIVAKSGKVFVGGLPKGDAIKLLEELTAVSGIAVHPTTSWANGNVVDVHVSHERATKKHGIHELLKIINVSKTATIGIGDYHNDLPLFESVGLKIAMGNAPDELKEVADEVVPDLENDGVAIAIEKFILNS